MSVSEPSSVSRKHKRNSTLALLDFSLPRLDCEQKLGAGQGIISVNKLLTNAGSLEGTAQFKLDGVADSHILMTSSPPSEIAHPLIDTGPAPHYEDDTIREIVLFDREREKHEAEES